MKLLVIITGEVNSGKTTLLNTLCSRLDTLGLRIAGIAQTVPLPHVAKTDYMVSDLSTGVVHTLMTTREVPEWTHRGRFFIDYKVFEWANRAILQTAGTSDVLVFDEIGPIELEGSGMVDSLRQVVPSFGGVVILAVRSALLEAVKDMFHLPTEHAIIADSSTPIDSLYESVLQRL